MDTTSYQPKSRLTNVEELAVKGYKGVTVQVENLC